MGGKAFASAAAPGHPTISTPRMTEQEYNGLKVNLQKRLESVAPSAYIGTMMEAPQKDTYGDIDFIIATDGEIDLVHLARQVGATAIISPSHGMTMAVRKDDQIPTPPIPNPVVFHPTLNPSPEFTPEEYAQVDITVIKSAAFHWYRFYTSYGDLAGILGFIVRKHGFRITDKGIYLRHELLDDTKELKYLNISDKSGMFYLSDDPTKVMQFLGLDPARWEQGFQTMDHLFQWLLSCRLLSRDVLENSRDISRDRQKERKRDMFSTFLFDYCVEKLPETTLSTEDSGLRLACQRPHLQDEAVRFFNVEREFTEHFTIFHQTVVKQQAQHLLRQTLGQHTGKTGRKLAELVTAFRKWTRFDDSGNPYFGETQLSEDESQLVCFLRTGLEELDERVIAFVEQNWEEAKIRARKALSAGNDQS